MKNIKVFTIDELSDEAREKAVSEFYDINTQDEFWYESTFEDAKIIGLKITSFDDHNCKGTFTEYATDVAEKILTEHGEKCETYQDAVNFLEAVTEAYNKAVSLDPDFYKDEYEQETLKEFILEELEPEFLHDLLESYRIILRQEYSFQTSEEQIVEALSANEYHFLEDGSNVNL